MATDFHIERDAFNAFIDSRLGADSDSLDLESALVEFRAYQRELAEVRAKVEQAKQASLHEESKPLDIDQLISEVTSELAAEGIRE